MIAIKSVVSAQESGNVVKKKNRLNALCNPDYFRIKKQGIALSFTWCMGGVTFFLFLARNGELVCFNHVLLSPKRLSEAYNDILALRDVTSLGILRELHRWGAHAMDHYDMASHVPSIPHG